MRLPRTFSVRRLSASHTNVRRNDSDGRRRSFELKNKGIPVVVLPESGVLRLPEQVLFGVGSADLQEKGIDAVNKLGQALQEVLPCYAGVATPASCATGAFGRLESVFIEGHTDDRPVVGRPDGNWRLSYERARAVYAELLRVSPDIGALNNDAGEAQGMGEKLLGISGYADQRPANSNDTADGRQANRRIDLRFIMAVPNPERQAQIESALDPKRATP